MTKCPESKTCDTGQSTIQEKWKFQFEKQY